MYYVDIFDLLFNGAEECELLETRPHRDYISIKKTYNFAKGADLFEYFYKNIYLGGQWEKITVGVLNDILDGIRGKGIFRYRDGKAHYAPFIPEQEKIIKKIGIWVF